MGQVSFPAPRRDAFGARPAHAESGDERLRSLLDALPVGVFTVDADGSILCCNEEAARLTGVPTAAARGRPCARVFGCTFCGPVCLAAQARRTGAFERDLPSDVRGGDGANRSVAVGARALASGEVAITLRDVTQAERLRRDLAAGTRPAGPAAEPTGEVRSQRARARDLDTRAALHRAAGNQTIAARLLGVHRTTLWRRMVALGIDRRRFDPSDRAP
jgi:PAS domain S-box-containing protein